MNEVSDKRWSVRLLPVPDTFAKEREVNNSIADFVAGVCRPLDPQVVKSVAVLFDSHVSIPEFASTSTLTKPVAENNVSILPSPTQFAMPPPNTAKVEIIVDNSGDGFVTVLKIIYFEKPVPTNIALKAMQWSCSCACLPTGALDCKERHPESTQQGCRQSRQVACPSRTSTSKGCSAPRLPNGRRRTTNSLPVSATSMSTHQNAMDSTSRPTGY